MKKVLITGVAGLLGNHLSRYLLDRKYDVVGIDNLSGGYIDLIDKRLFPNNFQQVDLLNARVFDVIVNTYEPDVIFHFAAYAALGLSPFIRNFNYMNNVIASVNVINACVNNNVGKLVFTSSMDVYGRGKPPFKETDTPCPVDPYGIGKYAVELDIKEAHDRFGLQYTIIRPHNVIGVYQNIWDRYRNVLGIWIRQILNGEPMTIYGKGDTRRAFSDVKYSLPVFEKVIDEYDDEIFNIGSDDVFTLIDAAFLLQDVAMEYDYESKIIFLEPRKEVNNAFCNHDKAKTLLEFNDRSNIRQVMSDMFKWAMLQPNRKIRNMDYEIDRDIYSFWKA